MEQEERGRNLCKKIMGSQLLWETNYFTSKKVYIWWKSSEEIQNIVSSIWSYDALKNVKKIVIIIGEKVTMSLLVFHDA